MRSPYKRFRRTGNKMSEKTLVKKQKESGRQGENNVAYILSQLPPSYIVFNNVLLKQGKMKIPYVYGQQHIGRKVVKNGRAFEVVQKTTQIDHVVVSPFGIFVIETKNHSGIIFGDANGSCWTQVLAGINKRATFTNPIIQNMGHIRALSNMLNIPPNYMAGIVVFANERAGLANVAHLCCNLETLPYAIARYNTPIWSMQETMYIAQTIQALNSSSKYNDAKHVKYVNKLKTFHGGV